MNYLKLLLAFGLGWAVVVALGLAADAAARPGGNESGSLRLSRINALRERVGYLEQQAKRGVLTKKVVAPFEVVNRRGERIFYVSLDHEVKLYRAGQPVAGMSAVLTSSGTLWASASQQLATLTPRGVTIKENGQVTMDLVKDWKKNNYRLVFYSGDKTIAAIGVSSVSNAGIALIADGSGSEKADIAVPYDYGVVEVEKGSGSTVARLTESNGGYFIACSAQGCTPPMVEAGDAEGYGVVRAGPLFYVQGPTGAPGSFLIGKK
jgi:hypothetical protein